MRHFCSLRRQKCAVPKPLRWRGFSSLGDLAVDFGRKTADFGRKTADFAGTTDTDVCHGTRPRLSPISGGFEFSREFPGAATRPISTSRPPGFGCKTAGFRVATFPERQSAAAKGLDDPDRDVGDLRPIREEAESGELGMLRRAEVGSKVMTTLTAYIEVDEETGLYVGIVPGIPGAHTQAPSTRRAARQPPGAPRALSRGAEGSARAPAEVRGRAADRGRRECRVVSVDARATERVLHASGSPGCDKKAAT